MNPASTPGIDTVAPGTVLRAKQHRHPDAAAVAVALAAR